MFKILLNKMRSEKVEDYEYYRTEVEEARKRRYAEEKAEYVEMQESLLSLLSENTEI